MTQFVTVEQGTRLSPAPVTSAGSVQPARHTLPAIDLAGFILASLLSTVLVAAMWTNTVHYQTCPYDYHQTPTGEWVCGGVV